MSSISVMQPYFMPYIGYFQLLSSSDIFVVYDNIQFTKKGWIHRNRILENNNDAYISLPLKKDSDFLDIRNRYLAESFKDEKNKILRRIENSYRYAPYFKEVFPLLLTIFDYPDCNLFNFIFNSLKMTKEYLEIDTPIVISSHINIDHSLKNKKKVMAIVKELGGDSYFNPIGGLKLYNKEEFFKEGIELSFLQSKRVFYNQKGSDFIPDLSIIDVMMFNNKSVLNLFLKHYKFV